MILKILISGFVYVFLLFLLKTHFNLDKCDFLFLFLFFIFFI